MSAAAFDVDFDEEHFECADSGAADTFPTAAGDLRRGDHVCIRGRACRILESTNVKGGKHGHCKTCIEAEDVFTGRRVQFVAPASYPMPCPFVKKQEFILIDIADDGALSLLDDDNEERNDLDLPGLDGGHDAELGEAIRAHFEAGRSLILVSQRAMGVESIVAFKVDTGR
jgi:translation initiation factor 5A